MNHGTSRPATDCLPVTQRLGHPPGSRELAENGCFPGPVGAKYNSLAVRLPNRLIFVSRMGHQRRKDAGCDLQYPNVCPCRGRLTLDQSHPLLVWRQREAGAKRTRRSDVLQMSPLPIEPGQLSI